METPKPMSASEQDPSPSYLQTLTAFHARFCSGSTMMPHVSSSNPAPSFEDCPQPMDLDLDDVQGSNPSDPISTLQTLVSNPNFFNTIIPPTEHLETLAIRGGEIRTGDVENSASVEADMAIDMASIFRVWDLNTQNPELENGTLTEVLTALVTKTENFWFDDGQRFLSLRSTIDTFDMRKMKSALDEMMIGRPDGNGGLQISISPLARLLESIL